MKRSARREAVTSSLLWGLLGTQKRMMWALLATMIGSATFTVQIGQQLVQMVDRGIVDQAVPLGGYVRTIIVLTIVGMVATLLSSQVGSAIGYRVEYDLRLRLYSAIHASDLGRLDKVASGQLITRSLTDITMVEQAMRIIPLIVGIVPVLLGLGIFLLIKSPLLGIAAIGSLPLNLWLLGRFRVRLRALTFAELHERSQVASAVDEPVKGIRVVRAFGREEHERAKLAEVALRTYRFAMTRWRMLARFDVPMKAAPLLSQAAVLGIGGALVFDGRLSLGTFVLAFQLVQGLTQMANYLVEIANSWQYVNSAQQRVAEVLALGD